MARIIPMLVLAACTAAAVAGPPPHGERPHGERPQVSPPHSEPHAAAGLAVGTFSVDVTPPLGTPLCDGLVPPAAEIVDPLLARGVVLLSSQAPIVLCAVDWVGIGNGGYTAWRHALAEAAGTTPDRVAVHALHQHDAPGCDFDAEMILQQVGLGGAEFSPAFARQAIDRVAAAVSEARRNARPCSHLGLGTARVERVASNRRILGPDGKVKIVRFSSTTIPEAIEAPEGVIDPDLQLVAFFDGEQPLAALTYYATHPQSYYGKGGVSADFPGLARAQRDAELPEVLHVHFNGAGGNVAAGKYNDGSPDNRARLAERLAAAMRQAWQTQRRVALNGADIEWRVRPVALPPSASLTEAGLLAVLEDATLPRIQRIQAARALAWLRRCQAGDKIELSALRLGPVWLVHLPGELFVEYQLAARAMRAQDHVCVAAYGDYGPGYIGTAVAYEQGGYETGPVSRVAPQVEGVLIEALQELLR
ncbi:MAG: hypothetical protein K6T86_09490 [Pirellulales bacterium]|nr:hypothetical protein [Pirellulales bacterium]